MNTKIKNLFWLFSLILIIWSPINTAQARYLGGEPPKLCACQTCNAKERCTAAEVSISRTEGNLSEEYFVVSLLSSSGPTLSLSLHYNSYNADNSHAQLDSLVGWHGPP